MAPINTVNDSLKSIIDQLKTLCVALDKQLDPPQDAPHKRSFADYGTHPSDAVKVFQWACVNGYLPFVKYCSRSMGLTISDCVRPNSTYAYAFRSACKYGHLSIVQYLVENFKSNEDPQAEINEAFQSSCENGHLPVIKYLVEMFKLKVEDVRAINNKALRLACKNGHLPVVQYLVETFGLTADDVVGDDYNDVIFSSCKKGHLPIVQYLVETFKLTAKDVLFDDIVLYNICKKGHLSLVQYLVETFKLTAKDFWRGNDTKKLLKWFYECCHMDVMEYLFDMIEVEGNRKLPDILELVKTHFANSE